MLPWVAEFRPTLESGKVLFRLDNLAARRFERRAQVSVVGFILEIDEAIRKPENQGRELRDLVDEDRLYLLLFCLTATHRLREGLRLPLPLFVAGLPPYGSSRWNAFFAGVYKLLSKSFHDEREEISDPFEAAPAPAELGESSVS